MKGKVWKEELGRAFRSRGFRISMILGLFLTMSEAYSWYQRVRLGMEYERRKGILSYNPATAFTMWFPFDARDWRVIVFYLLMPLLATMPFAISYLQDRKSGYIKNIVLRSDKKTYLKAKYTAVFLSGGTVAAVPLLTNLLAVSLYLPWRVPDSVVTTILPSSVWAELLYTRPFLYTFLLLAVTFITAGLYATLSLAATRFLQLKFAAFLAPFLISLLIYNIAVPLGWKSLVSFYFLIPIQSYGLQVPVYLGLLAAFALIGFFGFAFGALHDELI